MNRSYLELLAVGIFVVFFAFLFNEGLSYRGQSAYMPVAASGIGLLMCFFWGVHTARLVVSDKSEYYETNGSDVKRFALLLGVGVVYILGFVWLGFFTSTLIMVPSVSIMLGYRNKNVIIATTIAFTFILYAVFRLLLSIPLPKELILTLIGA